MHLYRLVVGPLGVNCYIIMDQDEALVIDPGGNGQGIKSFLEEKGFKLKYIVLTHGHFDHVGAVADLKDENVEILIHEEDLYLYEIANQQAMNFGIEIPKLPSPDRFLAEGDRVEFAGMSLDVIHTPGHTPGSISLYGHGLLFTGDTLFANSVGRTDFPRSSHDALMKSIKDKLFKLPDDTRVLPGHEDETTINIEKENNPFLR